MRPGTPITMTVALPLYTGRMRYQTFNHNQGNTPTTATYNKRGVITRMHWKTKTATIKWADGTISQANISNLKKMEQ